MKGRGGGHQGQPWLGRREVGKPLRLATLAWPSPCGPFCVKDRRYKTKPAVLGICVWMKRRGGCVLGSPRGIRRTQAGYGSHKKPPHASHESTVSMRCGHLVLVQRDTQRGVDGQDQCFIALPPCNNNPSQ